MKPASENKGDVFRALHERPGAFVIPNPWDVGSARILASAGFEALATTSAGLAFSLGLPEGRVSRDQVLAHCRDLAAASDLPVSADLEKGFGDSPREVAETIRAAAETGLAGCSIEDYTGRPGDPIYGFDEAVARIAAAAEACRALPHDFVLTARAENFLHGRPDLEDTVKRLQAFEAVGADVLYAPGLGDLETIRKVCAAVGKPVNVVMGLPGPSFGVQELAEAGVTRISVGAAIARLAYGAVIEAAREIVEQGTFDYSRGLIGFKTFEDIFAPYTTSKP